MARIGIIAGIAFLVSATALMPATLASAQPAAEQLPGPPAPASASTAPGPIPPTIFATQNIRQFLAICGNDNGGCADEVGSALIDKMVLDGSANICLPGPDYAAPALAYLKAHPEMGDMPTEDGIYQALRKVYSCG